MKLESNFPPPRLSLSFGSTRFCFFFFFFHINLNHSKNSLSQFQRERLLVSLKNEPLAFAKSQIRVLSFLFFPEKEAEAGR